MFKRLNINRDVFVAVDEYSGMIYDLERGMIPVSVFKGVPERLIADNGPLSRRLEVK